MNTNKANGNYDRYFNLQKRFYTRGTLRGIRILRMAKIPTLYRDCL